MKKNYLEYLYKDMEITQNWSGTVSHIKNSTGIPADYPIDDRARKSMICPCDKMRIARIYGVNSKGANTIWLESLDKVVMPCGEDYITIMLEHSNDSDFANLSVGKIFIRGEQIGIRGGINGNVTGPHNHIAICKGKFSKLKNKGWVKNNKNIWVLSGKPIKPEDAFYLNNNKIIKTKGLTFQNIPIEEIKEEQIENGTIEIIPKEEIIPVIDTPAETQINNDLSNETIETIDNTSEEKIKQETIKEEITIDNNDAEDVKPKDNTKIIGGTTAIATLLIIFQKYWYWVLLALIIIGLVYIIKKKGKKK